MKATEGAHIPTGCQLYLIFRYCVRSWVCFLCVKDTYGDSLYHYISTSLHCNTTTVNNYIATTWHYHHSSITLQLQSSFYVMAEWHYMSIDLQLNVVIPIGLAIAIRSAKVVRISLSLILIWFDNFLVPMQFTRNLGCFPQGKRTAIVWHYPASFFPVCKLRTVPELGFYALLSVKVKWLIVTKLFGVWRCRMNDRFDDYDNNNNNWHFVHPISGEPTALTKTMYTEPTHNNTTIFTENTTNRNPNLHKISHTRLQTCTYNNNNNGHLSCPLSREPGALTVQMKHKFVCFIA